MKRFLTLGLLLAAPFVAPVAALAQGASAPPPTVLGVPYKGPSVLSVPRHGQPSVLGIPQPAPAPPPPQQNLYFGLQGHQPVWVQPQWVWNGWQWVQVPGYWTW